jgi:hypothetical protein
VSRCRATAHSFPPLLISHHAQASGGVERKLLLCDGSGEDPSCHNSACYLGLCTSIADHLIYLGRHMYQDGAEC